jgi:ribosomal protein L6P/L9E
MLVNNNNIIITNIMLSIMKNDISVNSVSTNSYSDIVLLTGVGYRVELLVGNVLRLDVGYSHYVKVNVPNCVKVVVDPSGMRLTLTSDNKLIRGDTLYKIVSVRPRNPYTGAGMVIISKIDRLRKLKSTKADKTK